MSRKCSCGRGCRISWQNPPGRRAWLHRARDYGGFKGTLILHNTAESAEMSWLSLFIFFLDQSPFGIHSPCSPSQSANSSLESIHLHIDSSNHPSIHNQYADPASLPVTSSAESSFTRIFVRIGMIPSQQVCLLSLVLAAK